ncbi:RNA polymerase sigma factor [Amycolatopsis cihanbeyliensis]|uniref:RNA polymerase sigma factor n=1 Tax=Amycolatopsis cihanbeyliensis TaxID=1128664 RepID=UPI0024826DC0|nr:sigma-70 family RNA polymerase sigma factor [Amycolatopsis cihanbeyliensis]
MLSAAWDSTEPDSVVAGELDAVAEFEACYKAEFTRLVGFVIKIGHDEQEALDAAQVAFTEAWRQWKTIREPRAWLRKVVRRCLQYLPEVPSAEVADTTRPFVANEIEIAEETRSVLDALRLLPFRQRIVMAYKYDGFTPTEIARELDLTPESVRKTLQRARETLKQFLRGHGRDRDE